MIPPFGAAIPSRSVASKSRAEVEEQVATIVNAAPMITTTPQIQTSSTAPATTPLIALLGLEESLPTDLSLLSRINLREFFIRFQHLMKKPFAAKYDGAVSEMIHLVQFWKAEGRKQQSILLSAVVELFSEQEILAFGNEELDETRAGLTEAEKFGAIVSKLKSQQNLMSIAFDSRVWIALIVFLQSMDSAWIKDDVFSNMAEPPTKKTFVVGVEQRIFALCGLVELAYDTKKVRKSVDEVSQFLIFLVVYFIFNSMSFNPRDSGPSSKSIHFRNLSLTRQCRSISNRKPRRNKNSLRKL
jgi:hypothetical protein